MKFLSIPALFALDVFWGGFALATLWMWFVVPLGAPAISFAHAAGLNVLLFTFLGSRGVQRGEFDPVESFFRAMLLPFFSLAIGWCVHWLMLHA